jgi:uncharacterized OB-fold protein
MSTVRTRQARYRTAEREQFVRRIQEAKEQGGVASDECGACGKVHAWPAVRWRCECGREMCWSDVVHGGCECGGEVEVET